MSRDNSLVISARLTEEEARMLVELVQPYEKLGVALRRLVREAHDRKRAGAAGAGR